MRTVQPERSASAEPRLRVNQSHRRSNSGCPHAPRREPGAPRIDWPSSRDQTADPKTGRRPPRVRDERFRDVIYLRAYDSFGDDVVTWADVAGRVLLHECNRKLVRVAEVATNAADAVDPRPAAR